ncbi:hypothetical protein FBU30_010062 [Linnemannia zychae]|nr:hypothetical protein FBU30_010062 [Linnemannia zychae]
MSTVYKVDKSVRIYHMYPDASFEFTQLSRIPSDCTLKNLQEIFCLTDDEWKNSSMRFYVKGYFKPKSRPYLEFRSFIRDYYDWSTEKLIVRRGHENTDLVDGFKDLLPQISEIFIHTKDHGLAIQYPYTMVDGVRIYKKGYNPRPSSEEFSRRRDQVRKIKENDNIPIFTTKDILPE